MEINFTLKKPCNKLRQSVAGLSLRRVAFDARSAHGRFVVEKKCHWHRLFAKYCCHTIVVLLHYCPTVLLLYYRSITALLSHSHFHLQFALTRMTSGRSQVTIPENNSLSETGNYWMEGRLQCLVSAGFKVTSDGIYIYIL